MEFLISTILIIALLTVIVSIITYIFMGLSLSKISEIEGIDKKWFSWIPILNIIILLKAGNKNVRYIWLFIGLMIIGVLSNYSESGILIIINLALAIWTIVIQIQAYLNISNKYQVNSVWFIVGSFITPIMLVAYILLYKKVKKGKEIILN